MSIEQEIATLNENVALLAKAIANAIERFEAAAIGALAPVAAPEKSPRGRKPAAPTAQTAELPDVAALDKVAAQVTLSKPTDAPLEGDPQGTRYFVIEAHNTVYRQRPGDPDCTFAGSVEVPGATYLVKKEEFASKFKLAQSQEPAAPAPSPVPEKTADVVSLPTTFEHVVNAMRELHKLKGNPGLEKVLSKYKVGRIPQLNGVAPNDTLLAEIKVVMAGA